MAQLMAEEWVGPRVDLLVDLMAALTGQGMESLTVETTVGKKDFQKVVWKAVQMAP